MAKVPYQPFPAVDQIGAPGNDLQRIQNPEETYHGYLGQGEERIGAAEQGAGGALERGGEALDRGAASLQSFADMRQDQTNELYANDASTQGMQRLSQIWGDYNKLEGRAAHDAWPDYQKQLQGAYQDTLNDAPNPAAKVMLSRSMKQMTDYYLRSGQTYADSQWKQWYGESATARANEFSNQASLARQDPKAMDAMLSAGVDEAMKPLDASGATQDQRSAAAQRYVGVTVRNIVASKIEDGDVAGANLLLGRYGNRMDAASRLDAEKLLVPKIREQNAALISNYAIRGGMPPNLISLPGPGSMNGGEPAAVSSTPVSAPNPTAPTAGMRNNNPGNLKFSPRSARYAGVLGPSENTDQGDPQAVFANPVYGMAAAASLALEKNQGGKVTVRELVAENGGWTPGNQSAAANIARTAGVGIDQPINLSDPQKMHAFLRGIVTQEHGDSGKQYSDAMIDQGIALSQGHAVTSPGMVATTVSAPTGGPAAASARLQAVQPVDNGELRGSSNYMKVGPVFGDPNSPDFAAQHITNIAAPNGQVVSVNKDAAASFSGFLKDLAAEGYNISSVQGYNNRAIRGSSQISQHAFGNAIDVNPDNNPMAYANSPFLQKRGQMATDLPANVSDLAAKWGLTWGGDWHNRKDPMHFEWTGRNPQSTGTILAGNPSVLPPDQNNPLPDQGLAMQRALAAAGSDPELQKAAIANVQRTYSEHNVATATERQGLEATVPNLIQNAEAGVDGVQIPTDRILAVMPAAKAQAWIDEFHIAQQGGQIIKGLRFSSTADWQAAGQDLTSGQGVLSTMMKGHAKYASSGPGAMGATADNDEGNLGYLRLREGIGRQFMTQFMERNKMLYGTDADPAAYVHDEPSVTAARAGADPQNPASMEAYANSVLGVQTHLGVPDAAQHVLTRDDAQQMATKIMAPGMDAKTVLDGLKQQYGGAYQHVFSDMVTLGKLPEAYQSVQALDDPHDAALLSRAINETRPGSDGKAKDWNEILGNDNGGKSVATQISDTIRNDQNVMSFVRSLSNSGASLPQTAGIVNSMVTLAYAKRFYESQDADAAAADAVKSFTGKFEYMPNGGARVPSNVFDAVTSSAGTMLKNLSPDNIAIPPIFGQTGMPTQQEYLDSLRANPTWVTAPKGGALWLYDNGYAGRPARLVRTKDGQPVQVPFSSTPLPEAPQPAPPPNGPAPPAAPPTSQNDNTLLMLGTANGG